MEANYFQSLRKALSLLRCFTPQKTEWGGNEIVGEVRMHKTTVYRMLGVLVQEGVLERNDQTNKFSIGPALFSLGSLYLSKNNLFSAAEPVLKKVNKLTGEVTSLAIMDSKGHVTIVMREESRHALRIGFPVGLSATAYPDSMGKALLSELSEAEIDIIYPEENLEPFTQMTVPTRTQLKLELEEVRKTGVAYSNQQRWEGVEAVAAIIRDQTGKVVATTSIAVPTVRMNGSRRKALSTLVKLEAALISDRLGYQKTEVARIYDSLVIIGLEYVTFNGTKLKTNAALRQRQGKDSLVREIEHIKEQMVEVSAR